VLRDLDRVRVPPRTEGRDVSAELSACRVAARAALSDFRRDEDGADTLWLAMWAGRLAGVLGPVLDELDRIDTEGGKSR
jgi:hypothetical protein